jgi:hypothetical protein
MESLVRLQFVVVHTIVGKLKLGVAVLEVEAGGS